MLHCGSSNLKPYLTISYNVTVTHEKNAVGSGKNIVNTKGRPKNKPNANLTLS